MSTRQPTIPVKLTRAEIEVLIAYLRDEEPNPCSADTHGPSHDSDGYCPREVAAMGRAVEKLARAARKAPDR